MPPDSDRPRKRLKVASDPEGTEQNGEITSEHLQSTRKYEQLVPYRDRLVKTRQKVWANIKANLCEAILEQGQPLRDWIYACYQYVTAFGLAFTKEEHVTTIELCWKTLIEMQHDFALMDQMARLLCLLMRKPVHLSRDDLQLDWRPLYELYDKLFFSPHYRKSTCQLHSTLCSAFQDLTVYARIYFSKDATQEMLEEWKQYFCIYSDKFQRYLFMLVKFLPTALPPDEHQFGYKLWFDDFIKLWISLPNMDGVDYTNSIYLFSRLSRNTIGYIDWKPYLSNIFQRFRQRFDDAEISPTEISISAAWIISMITPDSPCLQYLQKLFLVPFPRDKELLESLLDHYIRRLRLEQNKKGKNFWYSNIPELARITPTLQKEFESFVWDLFISINIGKFDVELIYKVCLLCPDSMAEEVVRKFELAQERYFEPNRMQSALQLFSASLYHLVAHETVGPRYKSHVIPILNQLMQSINTTDADLCYLHLFAIRSIAILNIPLEDFSSQAKKKITTTKKRNSSESDEFRDKLFEQSLQLGNFPEEFLQICFSLIEAGNDDIFRATKKKLSIGTIIFDILKHICANISNEKYIILIDKLFAFTTTNMFESTECRTLLHTMLEATFSVDEFGYGFNKFFPVILSKIVSVIDGQTRYSDICKSEFDYYFSFFAVLTTIYNGRSFLRYQDETLNLLEKIVGIDFENNSSMMSTITGSFITMFTNLTYEYFPDQVYRNLICENDETRLCKFEEWPLRVTFQDISLNWNSPNSVPQQTKFARILFEKFIIPQMSKLNDWAEGKLDFSKSQLEKYLSLLTSIRGLSQTLPGFSPSQNTISMKYFQNVEPLFAIENVFDDHKNFRENLIDLMQKVIAKLKLTQPDNVQLFKLTITILELAMLNDYTYEYHKYFYNQIYKPLDEKTPRYPPTVLHVKLDVYHWNMTHILTNWQTNNFTPSHKIAVEQLFDLSTCSHTAVRIDAQKLLFSVLHIFPRVFELILPKVIQNLAKYDDNYDMLKGTLYVLHGSNYDTLLLSGDWNWILKLWPALVQVNYAEKLKIANLFDNLPLFSDNYYTVPIEKMCIAGKMTELFAKARSTQFNVPTNNEISLIEKAIDANRKMNFETYAQLISQLVVIMDPHKLHWRFYNLGLSLLDLLIRHDTTFPHEAIQVFLENLLHDSQQIRQTAILSFEKILFMIKSRNPKILSTIKGSELQCLDLQKDCFIEREKFEKTIFLDKVHLGYYVNCNYTIKKRSDFSSLDSYRFIANKFKDEAFLDQMFKLFALDKEGAENDHATEEHIQVWKYLFQMFKLFNADVLFPRIELLLQGEPLHEKKFALEVMIALAKAMPNFDFDHLTLCRQFFSKIFAKQLRTFSESIINYWDALFDELIGQNDIRRNYWVLEILKEQFTTSEPVSAFHLSSALSFISSFLVNNWRFTQESRNLLDYFVKKISHKIQLVRNNLSGALVHIFNSNIGFGITHENSIVGQEEFVDNVTSQLHKSLSPLFVNMQEDSTSNMASIKSSILDIESEAGQQLHNYLETIGTWVCDTISYELHYQGNTVNFFKLLPYFGLVQTSNETVQGVVQNAIADIASNVYKSDEFQQILPEIEKLSINWSWFSRTTACTVIDSLIKCNIFTLEQLPVFVNRLLEMTLVLLQDEVIEVRNAAGFAITTFITWNLIEPTRAKQLIQDFRLKASNSQNSTVIRHSAILGLAAQLYAHKQVPPHLPDILVFLSKYLHDRCKPIQTVVNDAFKFFKDTHQDKWVDLKHHFTAEQFSQLSGVLTSSSYIS